MFSFRLLKSWFLGYTKLQLRSDWNFRIQKKVSYGNSCRNRQSLERHFRRWKEQGHIKI